MYLLFAPALVAIVVISVVSICNQMSDKTNL